MPESLRKTGVSIPHAVGALHAMQTLTVPANLKAPARLLLMLLASHADNKTGTCFPAQTTLAAECGMSVRAVRYNLKVLEDAGLIDIQSRVVETASGTRVKMTNIYRVKNMPKFVGEKKNTTADKMSREWAEMG